MPGIALERLTGEALGAAIDDLARLRIAVFREWPYLYDGDLAYESRYLAAYAREPDSVLVAAVHDGRVVGASTGLPLITQGTAFQALFREHGHDPVRVFYFGESVLLPAFRGQGIGVRFFEAREAWARSLERFDLAAFCGVARPGDHPRRPAGHVPLDTFWEKRGFSRADGMVASLSWQDLDEDAPSDKPMQFWTKPLSR